MSTQAVLRSKVVVRPETRTGSGKRENGFTSRILVRGVPPNKALQLTSGNVLESESGVVWHIEFALWKRSEALPAATELIRWAAGKILEFWKAREKVFEVAKRDSREALRLARRIEEPFYRTHALAWVSRYKPDRDGDSVALEALRSSRQCDDDFKSVTSAAWPLRALIERGAEESASREVVLVQARIPEIQPNSSRSVALLLILEACFPLGVQLRGEIVEQLAALANEDSDWRVQRSFVHAMALLRPVDPECVNSLVMNVSNEKTRRRIAKELSSQIPPRPRPFFW